MPSRSRGCRLRSVPGYRVARSETNSRSWEDGDQGALVHLQRQVQGLDGFHVRWLVGSSMMRMLGAASSAAEQHASPVHHRGTLTGFLMSSQKSRRPSTERTACSSSFFLLPLCHPVEHIEIGVEIFGVILGVVADLGVLGPLDGAGIRCQGTDQRLDQVDLPIPLVPRMATFSPTSSIMLSP